MKKMPNGFSTVEGLLILIIVGIVGFAGWFVWSSNNKTSDSLNSAVKTSSSNTLPSPKKTDTSKLVGDKLSITPYSGEAIEVIVPSGWQKVAGMKES